MVMTDDTTTPPDTPRPATNAGSWWRPVSDTLGDDAAIAVAIAVASFLIRLPTRAQVLVNWDAVNFALGLRVFDLGAHQPHPPGYIGYVWLGRLLRPLTGDPNASLTLLSLIAGALAPVFCYLLARRFMSRGYAVATAGLFATSPVVWYYSDVALTYMVGGAAALALVWAAYVARVEVSRRHLLAASALLVLVGALRQTDLILLAPVWLYALVPFDSRQRWWATGVAAVGTVAWAAPLLWLSGGPVRYLRLSANLAEFVGGRTWLLSGNLVGLAQNLGLVAAGLLFGLNVVLAALVITVRRRREVADRLGDDGRKLLLVWTLPALTTYLLVHTGQIGYVLIILPAGFLLAGITVQLVASPAVSHLGRRLGDALRRALRPAGTVVIAGANLAIFLLVPDAAVGLLTRDGDPGPSGQENSEVSVQGAAAAADTTRQYDLPANDRHWREMTDLLDRFDPDTTAVLAVPTNRGSFRHLTYYTDDYPIYGLGTDRGERFGHLFTARDGDSDYSVDGFDHATRRLELADDIRTLLVPDRVIYEAFDADVDHRTLRTRTGAVVVAFEVPPDARLVFTRTDDQARVHVTTRVSR